jgi:sodium-dependent dicarboxylate transporter 2/3/5
MKKYFLFILTGILIFFIPDIFPSHDFLTDTQTLVFRVLILMIVLWITELIPTSVTALIPIIVAPLVIEIDLKKILTSYSSAVVFLILGGFIIAQGFERSKLHQRIALGILNRFGNTKINVLISICFLTASLSMIFSNTATCLLMLPIVKSIISENLGKKNDSDYSNLLLLAIAYSASIGGMATPIGTIPNAVFIGFVEENYNIIIDFKSWVFHIFPLVFILITLLLIYIYLRIDKPNDSISKSKIKKNYLSLGKFSINEKITSLIISLTAFLWIFKSKINFIFNINLTDAAIAIFGGILFFIIPSTSGKPILNNEWFLKIPWNILILFGGGLALASLIISSGLADKLSVFLEILSNLDLFLIILVIALFTSLLTEFTSNTATTFLLLPILSVFANSNNFDLIQILLPFILSASCAFMMPISTPPNAIVYSNNSFKIKFMVKNGLVMNFTSILTIAVYLFIFGGIK